MIKISSLLLSVAALKPGYKEKVCQQKLEELFQVDNEVRDKNTGHVYKVYDVTLGTALMVDAQDNVRMASWLSNLGRIKTEVADKWELVRSSHA